MENFSNSRLVPEGSYLNADTVRVNDSLTLEWHERSYFIILAVVMLIHIPIEFTLKQYGGSI